MEAKELRIGNWVHHKAKWSYLNDVEPLKEFDFQFTQHDFYADAECTLSIENDLEPIPLTEQWLLGFGFELYDYEPDIDSEDDFIYKDYKKTLLGKQFYYTICECPNNEWDFGIKVSWAEQVMLSSSMKYVHQLQNLYYALTGKELVFNPKQT